MGWVGAGLKVVVVRKAEQCQVTCWEMALFRRVRGVDTDDTRSYRLPGALGRPYHGMPRESFSSLSMQLDDCTP